MIDTPRTLARRFPDITALAATASLARPAPVRAISACNSR